MNARAVVLAALAIATMAMPQAAPPVGAKGPGAEDPEFVKRVNGAVDHADEWLRNKQQKDGGWGIFEFHSNRTYVAGPTALALLARIAAGENQHSEPIKRGFEFLKKNPPKLTYEVGLTLMAFDVRAAPVGERQTLDKMTPQELAKYAFPRLLEPAEREWLQPLVDRLARERFKECWSYGNQGTNDVLTTADFSNTQYAVLGLKAASRLGLTVDRKLFADLLDYVLDHQESSGRKVNYVDRRDGPDGKPTRYARKVEARGWAYIYGERGPGDVCASRVCIGIACTLLALDDLLTKGSGAPAQLARRRKKEANEAIESGLAWLADHFAVDHHPPLKAGPKGPEEPGYFYYYLYALERVGALTARKYIGEHDWYREGADELLKRQLPDGSWPGGGWDTDLSNTCFALLFLRRATLRGVVTGD